jgi:DNA polymerase-3 subunit delta'
MSFKNIKGQDRAIATLSKALQNDALAKAYLFSGPQGIGKRQVALALAATLNCEEGGSDACGRCGSCLKIKNNQHPDVRLIEDENNSLKIEQIRQMQREINLKPYEGRKKVYIIDNAHNLTAESSNALLKTLEEPPPESLIILVTFKPSLLFKTILSRCQMLFFSPLSRKELEVLLKGDYGLDTSRAHFLSYFCEGRLGDALRLKEAGFYQEKNRVIDDFALMRRHWPLEASAPETRDDFRKDINVLVSWFRDLYLLKTGVPEAEVINFDRRHELAKLADNYSFAELSGIFDFLSDAILHLEQNVNVKLLTSNLKVELWKG